MVPAHAGLFPGAPRGGAGAPRGPRARGAVPWSSHAILRPSAWSPRTRGCSRAAARRMRRVVVVPAHAGLFPPCPGPSRDPSRGPRARGAVPRSIWVPPLRRGWSPRTRGCSRCRVRGESVGFVVPAHAGLFPRSSPRPARSYGGPRARGAVPSVTGTWVNPPKWSPRTRGCSPPLRRHGKPLAVVPAHAGLFPGARSRSCAASCGPRARGAVPTASGTRHGPSWWSPRTRGCSLAAVDGGREVPVVPAHAGLFPAGVGRTAPCRGGPRARGAVPGRSQHSGTAGGWSPRTRGCSRVAIGNNKGGAVVPADAGLFRRPRGTS